jgi:ABC-type multidrug transport system fused ATPase/permease subunit
MAINFRVPSAGLIGLVIRNYFALIAIAPRTRGMVIATCLCGLLLSLFDVAFIAAMIPFVGGILKTGSNLPNVFGWLHDLFRIGQMSPEQTAFVGMIGLFIGLVVRQTIMGTFQTLDMVTGIRITQELRLLVLDGVIHSRMRYVDRMDSGEVKQVVAGEILGVAAFVRGASTALASFVTMGLAAILLLNLSLPLFLIVAAAGVALMPAKYVLTRFIHHQSTQTLDAGIGFMGALNEALAGTKQVKLLNLQQEVIGRLTALSAVMERARRNFQVISLWEPAITQIAALLMVTALFWSSQAFGIASLSETIGFCLVLYRIAPTLAQSSNRVSQLIVRHPSVARVLDLHRRFGREREADSGTKVISRPVRELRFDDVTFSYDGDRPVLQQVSWSAAPGDFVAFVGRSGSGKTSLVQLLLKLYRPMRGAVLVNGGPIDDLKNDGVRSAVGLITQDVFLFDTTVADVIRGGNADLPDEAVRRAAREAHADEFIDAMPKGYATMVGERGVLLSGGQRQRLMIASLFVRNPDVIIFDEATSALDAMTERGILEVLEEARKGRILIVVTHRVENLRNATAIHVLDGGRIVQSGTWNELANRDGLFRSLLLREEPEDMVAETTA